MIQTVDSGKPIEILLVEDNPDDVELTKIALRQGRISNSVHVAVDGVQAMAYLMRQPPFENAPSPDLVFLDLNLPKKDGRQLLAEMKEHPELRRIPVIVLTSSQDERDVKSVYESGGTCYVVKPVDFDKFKEVIKKSENFWFNVVKVAHRA